MDYWLVKSDPDAYGWEELVKDKQTFWDGVRNYTARNNLREMKKGDQVLFYHSLSDKSVVGLSEITKEAYQDPTTDDDRWVAVDIKAVSAFKHPVTLATIKATPALLEMKLVTQSRLSVMRVTKAEFDLVMKLGN